MEEAVHVTVAKNSFDLRSSVKATQQEIEVRTEVLSKVIETAKNNGVQIDTNYLLYHMRMEGYQTYTRNVLYKDRLALDSDNNYIRHFLPRYSRVQEDIFNSLDEMEKQCIELYNEDWTVVKVINRETKDGPMRTVITEDQSRKGKLECIKTRNKVLELKQKHCEGQNIQISAVIVQKEIATKKAQIIKKDEEIKKLTVLATKDQK